MKTKAILATAAAAALWAIGAAAQEPKVTLEQLKEPGWRRTPSCS